MKVDTKLNSPRRSTMILPFGITIGRRSFSVKCSRMRAATTSQLQFLQFLMQKWPFEDPIKKANNFLYPLGNVPRIGKVPETDIFWVQLIVYKIIESK